MHVIAKVDGRFNDLVGMSVDMTVAEAKELRDHMVAAWRNERCDAYPPDPGTCAYEKLIAAVDQVLKCHTVKGET